MLLQVPASVVDLSGPNQAPPGRMHIFIAAHFDVVLSAAGRMSLSGGTSLTQEVIEAL